MNEDKQNHFKVVYGKIFGIPTGSATPITPKGNRIFTKYFIPFFIACGTAVFSNKLTSNSTYQAYIFMACSCIAAITAYLFMRQLKHTAIFERQYFVKRNNKED